MKAIYLNKYGSSNKAFEIKETALPKTGDNEVCIKVSHFGLNFADVVARRGLYPDAPKNPAVLGYDVSGEIHEIGKKVTRFKKGDKVVALTRFGGYAEYVTTMQEGVALMPQNYDPAKATALATQACTAYFCAVHCVNLISGDNVLVQAAAGGVGRILVQIAKSKGCTVFGTCSTTKINDLKESGVDYVIDYTREDFYKKIMSILNGSKLDYVFDSIGGKAFKKGWKLLQPGGTMVNFGAADQVSGNNKLKALSVAASFGFFSPIQLLMASKSMIAVNMLRIADHKPHLFQKVLEGVIDMVNNNTIDPYLDSVYNATEIDKAHAHLESRKSKGKVVMEW